MDNNINVRAPSTLERATAILANPGDIDRFHRAHFHLPYRLTNADSMVATRMVLDMLRADPLPSPHTIPAGWPDMLAWPPTLNGNLYSHYSVTTEIRRMVEAVNRMVEAVAPGENPLARLRDRLLAYLCIVLKGCHPGTQEWLCWQARDDYSETVLGMPSEKIVRPVFYGEPWFDCMTRNRPWLRTISATPGKPDMLRFYPTLADAQRGRHADMRIGRFLARYKDGEPEAKLYLTEDRIRKIAEQQHKAMATDYTDEAKYLLLVGDTRGEFKHAYTKGPHSCMSGEFNQLTCHPAEVYASGDFAIAMLVHADDADKVIARCVLHPKTMTGSTLYPNPNSWSHDSGRLYLSGIQAQAARDELRRRLSDLGYECEEPEFLGARLLRISEGGYSFIAPYLDGGFNLEDDGDYLILCCNGDGHSTGTDGTVQMREPEYCDACGDESDYRDSVATDTNPTGTRGRGYEDWCEHCRHHSTFFCDAIDESISDQLYGGEMQVRRHNYGGRLHVASIVVNQAYLDHHAFHCEWQNAYYAKADFTEIEVDGVPVCLEQNVEGLFWCRHHLEFFAADDENPDAFGFHRDVSFRDRALTRMREIVAHGAPVLVAQAA